MSSPQQNTAKEHCVETLDYPSSPSERQLEPSQRLTMRPSSLRMFVGSTSSSPLAYIGASFPLYNSCLRNVDRHDYISSTWLVEGDSRLRDRRIRNIDRKAGLRACVREACDARNWICEG